MTDYRAGSAEPSEELPNHQPSGSRSRRVRRITTSRISPRLRPALKSPSCCGCRAARYTRRFKGTKYRHCVSVGGCSFQRMRLSSSCGRPLARTSPSKEVPPVTRILSLVGPPLSAGPANPARPTDLSAGDLSSSGRQSRAPDADIGPRRHRQGVHQGRRRAARATPRTTLGSISGPIAEAWTPLLTRSPFRLAVVQTGRKIQTRGTATARQSRPRC